MANVERIHSLNRAFNNHDAGAIASHFTDNAVVSDPIYPNPLRGRAEIEKDMSDFFRAFPDIRGELSAILDKDNMTAEQWVLNGTNKGPLVTPEGEIPASGKKVKMEVGVFTRFDKQGLITEQHRYYNVAGLLEQLGQTGLAQSLTE